MNRSLLFLSIAGGLVMLHLIAVIVYFGDFFPDLEYWHIAIFDLDEEESFGTWFSALILFFAARLLLERSRKVDGSSVGWKILAIGFCVLSIDEVVGLHEWMNTILEDIRWTHVAIVGVLIVGALFVPFLKSLSRREALSFLLSGAVYVGGAVGVEMATESYADEDLLNTLAYNLWTCLEEGMEMLGVILFIHALERKRMLGSSKN